MLFSVALTAQQNKYPVIKSVADSVDDFVPQGWAIMPVVVYGDLNKDQLIDAAFVIQTVDTLTEYLYNVETKAYDQRDNSGARILIILFKNTDGKYHLAVQNNDFILRPDEGGMCCDPFPGLKIQNGTLNIPFYGGMSRDKWEVNYVFRYQDHEWYLIGATSGSSHLDYGDDDTIYPSGQEYSYNFITKKLKISTSESDKDKPSTQKEEWKKISTDQLKTFKTFIRPFTWEIEKDTYL